MRILRFPEADDNSSAWLAAGSPSAPRQLFGFAVQPGRRFWIPKNQPIPVSHAEHPKRATAISAESASGFGWHSVARGASGRATDFPEREVVGMNGFVKLRRGLAEHVRSGRMTLSEHGAFTLLLQLADYSTGRWHGTQRSFALAAGISSGLAWKFLTSLERKGYLAWHRDCGFVEILKYSVENPRQKPVQNPVEMLPVRGCHGQAVDHVDHSADQLKRNRRNPWNREYVVDVSSESRVLPSHSSEGTDRKEIFPRNRISLSIQDLAQRKSVPLAFHPLVSTRARSAPAVLPFVRKRNPP